MKGFYTAENFEKHHAENPHIYEMFRRFALEAARYHKRFSAQAVYERIRWETMLTTTDKPYKLNAGWLSHYARKFMKDYPHLDGFFETRVRANSYHSSEVAA